MIHKAPRIVPNLWFATQAEEAARFYVSLFPNSSIGSVSYYGSAGNEVHGMEAGSVMTVEFTLDGQDFVALNGGPVFTFNEAVSFIINCGSQEEADFLWGKLSEGGDEKAQACGWLKDKYGLSWQVIPAGFSELMNDPDPKKADRMMEAMLKMKKLDIHELKKAAQNPA